MASEISGQFASEQRIIATEPNISRNLMMTSAGMHSNGFTVFKATTKGSRRQYYVLPSAQCPKENATFSYYKSLTKQKWTSFDEYVTYAYQMFWLVSLDETEWKTQSTCTCPVFLKQHICKHIVALALREEMVECPNNANPMLLAARNKPGRKKNAYKSLMRQ